MKTFSQNSNADIFMDSATHQLAMCGGVDANALVIKNAIMTVLGEIQLDTTLGIDYFGTIFNNVNAEPNWRTDVQERILKFDFVNGINSMDVAIDSSRRKLSYTIVIDTDYGEMTVSS